MTTNHNITIPHITNHNINNTLSNPVNTFIEIQPLNNECMICLDDINLGVKNITCDTVILECNHAYHYQCLLQWIIDSHQVFFMKVKCPLCNQFMGIKIKYYPNLKKTHQHLIENIHKPENIHKSENILNV